MICQYGLADIFGPRDLIRDSTVLKSLIDHSMRIGPVTKFTIVEIQFYLFASCL